MTFPALLREYVETTATTFTLTNEALSIDVDCAGAKHHSPQPLRLTKVRLIGGDEVFLCGTCKDNLDILKGLIAAHDGPVPWPLLREFGNQIRALAKRSTHS